MAGSGALEGSAGFSSQPPLKPARIKPVTMCGQRRINCHSKPVRWFSIIRMDTDRVAGQGEPGGSDACRPARCGLVDHQAIDRIRFVQEVVEGFALQRFHSDCDGRRGDVHWSGLNAIAIGRDRQLLFQPRKLTPPRRAVCAAAHSTQAGFSHERTAARPRDRRERSARLLPG